jgi:hypothetical protein
MKKQEVPRESKTLEEFLGRVGPLQGFAGLVAGGWFFRWLDRAGAEERPALVGWLRLLRTEVIEGWFRSGIRKPCGSRATRGGRKCGTCGIFGG